jgi:hypothetical protein
MESLPTLPSKSCPTSDVAAGHDLGKQLRSGRAGGDGAPSEQGAPGA